MLLFSRPAVSNSLWLHGQQHAWHPCSPPSPEVCPSSCSLHQWCHPVISFSDALYSFCPQSFPASGTSMSHLCTSDDQITRAAASASVLPDGLFSIQSWISVNIQRWSPLRLTGLISLLSRGLSGVFSSTTIRSHQFSGVLPSLQSSCHVTTWKTIALTIQTFVGRVMSLLFNTLSRFVIAFLSRSNCLLISWLQSLSAVILEPKKRKSVTTSTFSPSICYAVIGPDAMILVFSTFRLKSALSLCSFTLIKRLFSSSLLSAIRVVSFTYLRLLMFLPPIYLNSSS